MRRRTTSNSGAWVAAVLTAAVMCFPHTSNAAERITLSNGFDVECDHHSLVDGRVRVYLKAEAADYFELMPEAIRGYDSVPDALKETPKETVPAATQVAQVDGKLTSGDLHQLLAKAGSEHNVDADLLASLVKAESGGNARATSRAGARGLMQLMPGTARELGVADSFAPEQNVRGGTAYLDGLLTRYHDNIALALAAYNAGPEAVDRYHGIPPYRETRVYVARVIHEFNARVRQRLQVRKGNSGNSGNALLAMKSERVGHE